MNKSEARKYIGQLRKELTDEQIEKKSGLIFEKIRNLDEFIVNDNIYVYVSYNKEVETIKIIKNLLKIGKKVLVPKVYDDIMKFHCISDFSELKKGNFGILEPDNEDIFESKDGLIIMPGLAFDINLNRSGYGGGYYDKYLAKHPGLFKIAVAYDLQIVDSLETDEYDIRPDMIVTEKRIIRG